MKKTQKKKRFVISALTMNLHQYSFVNDLLKVLLKNFKSYEIILLVNKKGIVNKHKKLREIEFPLYKKNIIYRLYLFYFGLKKFSKEINADIWLSTDSLTPNIISKKLFTYYHTPSPFFKLKLPNLRNNIFFYLQGGIYNFFIKLLIKTNTSLIVQSKWMKKIFIKKYKIKNIIIAPLDYVNSKKKVTINKKIQNLFYQSYPYIYKNFEILGQCAKILDKNKNFNGKIILTMNTNQNKYSKNFFKTYSKYKILKFVGYQSRSNIFKLYKNSDALIFPSFMETWGLPLSEAKKYDLPIIASNLNYAKESIGSYHSTIFFDPKNANQLANILLKVNMGKNVFKKSYFNYPKNKYAENNNELINFLINE